MWMHESRKMTKHALQTHVAGRTGCFDLATDVKAATAIHQCDRHRRIHSFTFVKHLVFACPIGKESSMRNQLTRRFRNVPHQPADNDHCGERGCDAAHDSGRGSPNAPWWRGSKDG